ncbi:MAG: HDIG domain-containing protein [Chloroflexota bacterium]|nr:HDIG domain-containing protein [Chloroflexota bacterium]
MVLRLTDILEERFSPASDRTQFALRSLLLLLFALLFIGCCTAIVAFDDIFLGASSTANLVVGSVPAEDIIAQEERLFVSEILIEQERQNVLEQVPTVYHSPDPNVARQQRVLTENILQFIDNVRADSFASLDQQVADVNEITSLILDDDRETIVAMLQLPEERWTLARNEIISVLERVMRDPIRNSDLQHERDQLPTQVSLRLSPQESHVVTMITGDVIRANTFENPEQTALDRELAVGNVEPQQRHFIAGQIVAPANQRIDNLSFEALQELGLLAQTSNRGSRILRAVLASAMVTLMIGLYISRFELHLLLSDTGSLLLQAALFLIALVAVRSFGTSNIYLMPAAALGILYVALSRPNLAIVATIGFAFLAGILGRSPSLENASLVAAANISAILTLRNAGRLNNYFLSGLVVGISNVAVVAIFALLIGFDALVPSNLIQGFFNGLLIVPTTSFAAMYILTVLFNLPTPFKLMDLSQPSKPLLQRLLREAPGTYQHSLQVANLAEQASEAIGADTQLTHVAALYHDVGKMSNPYFFTENQQQMRNPHDGLNDPYRSADIIVDHVIEGDHIAKNYNLPNRIRDFIREHHGTTEVFVFYQRALDAAKDAAEVDPADFSYPGPIPQSRETAILMLADSCESAIRAVHPESNREITELVHRIVDSKRKAGQLDASQLTLNDLRKIEETFIDVFKGLFHTRIDYARAVKSVVPGSAREEPAAASSVASASDATAPIPDVIPESQPVLATGERQVANAHFESKAGVKHAPELPPMTRAPSPDLESIPLPTIMDDDEPLDDVPPLPKRNGTKTNQQMQPASVSDEANESA